jgi:biotin carboxyl carrier protein
MSLLKFIEVDGKMTPVYAQKLRGEVWLHFNGRTFIYEDESQSQAKKKGAKAAHAGDLLAPMPGKVTKLLKNAGEDVKKGDVVIVMEAMKMEYTLKSDGDGKITAINCQVNEQVSLGKVLAHITPKQGPA